MSISNKNNYQAILIEKLQTALDKAIESGDLRSIDTLSLRLQQAIDKLPSEYRLWSDEDVMRFLNVTKKTLGKMRSDKRIPYIKNSGVICYNPESLIQWAKRNEIKMDPVWRKSA